MKKKVLHIVEAFGGGIFTFMVDLINSTTNDYEIVLACSIRPQTPDNYKDYFNKDVKIIELENGGRNINPKKDIKLFFEIKKIIKAENAGIIHLHSSKAGILGRFASNNKKTKVLYNPHGFAFLKEDEKQFKKSIYKLIEIIAAKKCGHIVGVSNGEYQEALKITRKSYLISNGIDIDRLPTQNLKQIDTSNLSICTLGRISYQKNPEEFNNIAKRFPEIKFTWIGEGEMLDKLDSSNIKVTGWKSKDEALKLMNECDIFILTSLWEGLPIALLEAMYYKKICIVSNVIGNRDVIDNGENGFVTNDLGDFTQIINSIINKKVNIRKIQQNAHNDILVKYDFNIVSRNYKQLYDSLEKDINYYKYISDSNCLE